MKFDENKELKRAREKLLEFFSTKNRGELIKHEEIENLIGMKRSDVYYSLVRRVGELHQEARGISIISEPMIGYLMATHEQQLGLLGKRTRRAKRQLSKGTNSVYALPDNELSDHQRRVKSACVENGEKAIKALRHDQALQAYLMRSKPGEPLKIKLVQGDKEA